MAPETADQFAVILAGQENEVLVMLGVPATATATDALAEAPCTP